MRRRVSVVLECASVPELTVIAAAQIPGAIAARVAESALPPAFVARRALDQLGQGKPALWPGLFYIACGKGGRIVGTCGFKDEAKDGVVEIGYGVSPRHQGRGIATAAVSEMLRIAFQNDATVKVLAEVSPANLRSTRVVRKLGFAASGSRTDEDNELVVRWFARSGD